MYGNLKRRNLGDFNNVVYYSSTQIENWGLRANVQNFSNGAIDSYNTLADKRYVRPIRQVAHP
jgi:hypothetical protein